MAERQRQHRERFYRAGGRNPHTLKVCRACFARSAATPITLEMRSDVNALAQNDNPESKGRYVTRSNNREPNASPVPAESEAAVAA
jgi:hypothetical protein